MTAPAFKVTKIPNNLGKKLQRPGGILRDQALKDAGERVENLREQFVGAIPGEIAALEAILANCGAKVPPEGLDAMVCRAGQILTLSGTFGLDLLDTVVKYFCDLAVGMIEKNIDHVAPVSLHLRAMRLVCPGGTEFSQAEVDHMLAGLTRVHAHYGIAHLSEAKASEPGEPKAE